MDEKVLMLLEKVQKLALSSTQTLNIVSGPTMSVRKGLGVTGKSPEVVSELDVEHGIWTNKSLDEKIRVLPEKVRKLSLYFAYRNARRRPAWRPWMVSRAWHCFSPRVGFGCSTFAW